jgi:hypothetical protein
MIYWKTKGTKGEEEEQGKERKGKEREKNRRGR